MRLTEISVPYGKRTGIQRISTYQFERLIDTDVVDFDVMIIERDVSRLSHYELKQIAKPILEERGFNVLAPKGEIHAMYDVIARKGDIEINVEVGITPICRIYGNLQKFDEVWWIPYQDELCYIYIFKRGKYFWDERKMLMSEIMIKCPKCNARNFHEANFCGMCGNPLPSDLPKYCKTCGQKIPEKLVYPRKELL